MHFGAANTGGSRFSRSHLIRLKFVFAAIVSIISWQEYSSPAVPAMLVALAPRPSPRRDMTVSCSTTSYLVIANSSAGDHWPRAIFATPRRSMQYFQHIGLTQSCILQRLLMWVNQSPRQADIMTSTC